MKTFLKTFIKTIFIVAILAFGCAFLNLAKTSAIDFSNGVGFSMTPMYEKLILNPGDIYKGSFEIFLPSTAVNNFNYKVYVQNYYRDDNNNAIFENVGSTGLIVDWITIDSSTNGTLAPDEKAVINYTIKVPLDAPGGGQYATITVGTDNSQVTRDDNSTSIQESVAMGYTIYAEITGNTVRQGEIWDVNVSSLLMSGNIKGASYVKNTGNVHSTAKYTLQVFPLFSDEEVYSNEEDPVTRFIMPDRTLYNETSWDQTPMIGIFNVIYTVEFEGVTQQIKKLVIVCPLWLLFIVLFIIVALIVWIVIRIKMRKKAEA